VWIKSFRIQNFKSFDDSGTCQLDRHINLIVGQNHSGKTALLKAIGRPLVGIPHRSSKLRRGEAGDPLSRVELEFVAAGQEAKDVALARNMSLQMPIPREWANALAAEAILDRVFSFPEVSFRTTRLASEGAQGGPNTGPYPSVRFPVDNDGQSFIHFSATPDRKGFRVHQMAHGGTDDASPHFDAVLASRTYYFDAQRIPQNDFVFGNATQLSTDAANLAQMLIILQANRSEYAEYVAQVRRVIPLIKWVSVVPSARNPQNVEIRIWNVDESTGRDDLTIPLAECGTGIGQVLSILYVVLKSEGNVIVVDEPNSFLHPRAAKALVGIFREDHKNQYIITTHSPEVIVASEPERLFVLGFADERTSVRVVDRSDLSNARHALDEIGSRLSDVFGADRVLWVEGPTEVECFPLLLRAVGRDVGGGVAIASLRNTGDLESRHGEVIADIYRNLSKAHVVLPTPIAVVFDGDKSGMANKEILKRAFGDVLRFLSRRCYENYLINDAAVSAVLNMQKSFQESPTNEEAVQKWIAAHGKDAAFKASQHEPYSAEWLSNVDAPRLLDALFQELSASKEIYRKTVHSVELTRWLVQNDRPAIQELIEFVAALVPED
jgi:energy-coupling factor transporter ATP-binding protein EcfA2